MSEINPNNTFPEIGDMIKTIKSVNCNIIYIEDGYPTNEIREISEGVSGKIEVVDSNERVVVRVPIQRKNAYYLFAINRNEFEITEKHIEREEGVMDEW